MVAYVVFDEVHVTCVVISFVVPSAYVPVAVNCRVLPKVMYGLVGVTVMKIRGAEVTVRVAVPEIEGG